VSAASRDGARIVIVNADDLGRTTGINSGIFEAHRRGLVTSATLMVAYAAAEDAAAQLAENPALGVGLHVALTGGPPVLPAERLPSLVDAAGRLPAKPENLDHPDPAEVMAEARAQFDRFLELVGRPPTHLDSHHHSHRQPVVLDAVVTLAREHGLPVRNASPEVAARLRSEGLATTDFFIERFFGEDARLEVLLEILAGLEPGTTEIMCHPAHVGDELRASSSYADARERELAVLTHPEAVRAVQDLGLSPATFAMAWPS